MARMTHKDVVKDIEQADKLASLKVAYTTLYKEAYKARQAGAPVKANVLSEAARVVEQEYWDIKDGRV